MKSKKRGNRETAKQIKTRCHGCGKVEHKKENCWELESNKNKIPKKWNKNS
jgi:hypothetical protein